MVVLSFQKCKMPMLFSTRALAVSLFAVALASPPIHAGDSDTESRLQTLEQELADLKLHEPSAEPPISKTWEAGAELTLMRPAIGSLALGSKVVEDQLEITPSYDLNAAYRVWLGRQSSNGLGWRIAFWRFADSASLDFDYLDNTTLTSDLDLYAIDIEATHTGKLASWELFSSIGVRIGGVGSKESLTYGENAVSFDERFTGAGLTFSIGTRRPLGNSHWSLYGGFRGSLMYGASDFSVDVDAADLLGMTIGLDGSVVDRTVSVFEMQVGLQYERSTAYGQIFGRLGLETQLWELPPVVAGIGDKNIGLIGPTFTFGLRR